MSSRVDPSPGNGLRVLFVCTANLCRSPIAEHLLRSKLRSRTAHWTVRSAGVNARSGLELPDATVRVLDESGVRVATWQTTRLTADLANRSDLVLTAEADHRRAVVSLAPAAIARTFTILEFARLLSLSEMEISAGRRDQIGRALIDAAAAGRGRPQSRDAHDTDIVDPIGRPEAELRQTAGRIGEALDQILSVVRMP